jgi:hypothetical protein
MQGWGMGSGGRTQLPFRRMRPLSSSITTVSLSMSVRSCVTVAEVGGNATAPVADEAAGRSFRRG